MTKVIIGSFDNVDDADRAYRDLLQAGYPDADLNLVVSNTRSRTREGGIFEGGTSEHHSTTTKGAVAGGVLGGAAGLAAGLMGVSIPGIGPILGIGAIVATLAGAGAGAVAGGLLGSLINLGIHKDEAELYAESVRRGGSLVTARSEDEKAEEATAIMRKNGAIDIARRAEEWRARGWTGHDQGAETLTPDEVDRERADRERYRAEQGERPVMGAAEGLSDSAWQPPRGF